ncbi:MAG: membrane protein insertion efficiency factor YidD [Phycisphaerales bacterium]|nr:membrane protein insertion efficiency factor YidD [Phycisphaerales bacterium]
MNELPHTPRHRRGLASRAFSRLLLALIAAYRATLSPIIGRQCRFLPTCSLYAREAIATHGVRRGCLLAVRRLSRCHPWGPAGYDPVPPPSPRSERSPSQPD